FPEHTLVVLVNRKTIRVGLLLYKLLFNQVIKHYFSPCTFLRHLHASLPTNPTHWYFQPNSGNLLVDHKSCRYGCKGFDIPTCDRSCLQPTHKIRAMSLKSPAQPRT